MFIIPSKFLRILDGIVNRTENEIQNENNTVLSNIETDILVAVKYQILYPES